MSRMKLFALEEEEVGDEAVIADSVEQVLVEGEQELNEVHGAVDDVTNNASDGMEAVDELAEVKDVMDQSIEAGTGLDPVAAEMARISIRNILSKIGAEDYTGGLIVASESFGSTSSRLANTRYASESVGDFITNILTKVKDKASSLKDKFTAMTQVLFKNIAVQKKLIADLRAKVNSTEFGSEEVTVNGSSLKGFNYASVDEIKKGIKLHSDVLSDVNKVSDNFLSKVLPRIKEQMTKNVTKETKTETESTSLTVPSNGETLYKGRVYTLTADSSKLSNVSIITKLEYKNKDSKVESIKLSNNKAKLLDLLDKTEEGLVDGEKSARENLKSFTAIVAFFDTNLTGRKNMVFNTILAKVAGVSLNQSYVSMLYISTLSNDVFRDTFSMSSAIIKYVNLCVKENGKKAG